MSAEEKSLSAEEKDRLKHTDKVQHKHRRKSLSAEEKDRLKQTNRVQHERRRKSLSAEEKDRLKQTNRVQHERRRKSLSAEEKDRLKQTNRVQHERRRKSLSAEEKDRINQTNRVQHARRRKSLSAGEKNRMKASDKLQHERRRKLLSTKGKDRLRICNRVYQQRRRQLLSQQKLKRLKECNRLHQQHKRKSLSAEERQKLQEKDKAQHKKRRVDRATLHASFKPHMSTTHEAVKDVVTTFLRNIRDGPTYECSVCNRFLYRTSVKHVTEKLVNMASGTLTLQMDREWICMTCVNSISRRKVPQQAAENNMAVSDIPQELKNLSGLEKQLISKVIPFMKILSLPKGAQQGLKGQVVLVPSNTQLTAASLPRNTSEAQIVALNLKRRLSDKSTFCKEYIRPQSSE